MTQITETKAIDQITVTETGYILYREATRIMRGDEQIAQTYHRTSLTPGQDLTGVPANVVAICNVAWTPEVVAAYQAAQEALAANIAEQKAPKKATGTPWGN